MNKSLRCTTEDAILGVVYIPPEGSRYSTNDCFLEIEQELINITNGNNCVCLFGDFNSRTGHLEDFFTPDHFLSNVTHSLDSYQYHTEKRSVIFENHQIPLKRVVKDCVTNNFGYKLTDLCKNNELYIVNSRIGSDKNVGNLTCRNSSTVDYVLASIYFLEVFIHFDVLEFSSLFSDVHNPVSFSLSTNYIPKCPDKSGKYSHNSDARTKNTCGNESKPSVKLWCPDKANQYCNNINLSSVNALESFLNELSTQTDRVSEADISKIANEISNIFSTAAMETFGLHKNTKLESSMRNKQWFNKDCRTARKKFHLAKRINNRHKTVENKTNVVLASKEYKKVMDNCVQRYRNDLSQKLKKITLNKSERLLENFECL